MHSIKGLTSKQEIATKIKELVGQYFSVKEETFIPGDSYVQYAGAVYDENEIRSAIDVLLKGWFGLSVKGKKFEAEFPKYFGKTRGVLVNSGSSANLLAVSALRSKNFSEPLQPGDEVISCAVSFPTTINPIINNHLVPVFVDNEIGTYNIDVNLLEKALSPKTKAIFFAHTLGNPANMEVIQQFVKQHNLILLEDCCDALGASFDGQPLGSFGRMATSSFYPAHHMTMGEGGFVSVNSKEDFLILQSLRDWGRACYCSGAASLTKNGVCNNRFAKWLDDIDVIVDHKYVYSEIGYNLKPLELQAAIGLEQLNKLPYFEKQRRENFAVLYNFFANYEEFFVLPRSYKLADPCWFSFPLTINEDAPFTRAEIVNFLEDHRIQTRNLFAGNLLRHPAYKGINCRVVGSTEVADLILTNTFMIGVYPGITEEMRDFILKTCKKFLDRYKSNMKAVSFEGITINQ